jgi:hypothetical protein
MTSTFSIDSFLCSARVNEPKVPVCNNRRHSLEGYQPYQPLHRSPVSHRSGGVEGEYRVSKIPQMRLNNPPKLSIEIPQDQQQQSMVSPTQSQLESPIYITYQSSLFPPAPTPFNNSLETPPESPIKEYFPAAGSQINLPPLHHYLNAPITPYEPFPVSESTSELFNRPLLFGDGQEAEQYPLAFETMDTFSSAYSFQPNSPAFSPHTRRNNKRKSSLFLDPTKICPPTSGAFSCPCGRVFVKRCGMISLSLIARSDLAYQVPREERRKVDSQQR